MVNRPIRMNLQWSSRAPCIRAGRLAHKRLDSDDQPPAKCARLSAEAGDTQGLLGTSPGSPVSPGLTSVPPTHQGPSSIGSYLLLPLVDRECMHSAMNTDTGIELLCKVCAIQSLCNFFEWRIFQDIPLPNTLSDMSSVFGWVFHQMSFSREMCHDFRNKSLTSLYIFILFYFLKCLNLIRILSFLHVVKEQPNPVLPVLYVEIQPIILKPTNPWHRCFALCLSTGLICIHVTAVRHAVTHKNANMWGKKALVIRIFPDKDRVLHCSRSLFILHDRPAGVWLCWLIKLIASRFDDSFVTRLQKQCIELESKHIPSFFYVAAKCSWLFT